MDTTGKIIAGFVLLMIGVIFTGIASDLILAKTTQTIVTDEGLSLAAARTGMVGNNINESYYYHLDHGCAGKADDWRVEYSACGVDAITVKNASGNALTETTDYVITAMNPTCSGVTAGDLHFVNSTALVNHKTSNSTTITYGYCGDEYLGKSWSISVLNMVAGFLALLCLAGAVAIFFSVYQDFKN